MVDFDNLCYFLCNLGDITDEPKVFDWLINNRATGDDTERLEDVTAQNLEAMTSTKDGLVVLFCK